MPTLNLGKVRITFGGQYDSTQNYELLTIVDNEYGVKYISTQDVPAGTLLSNDAYWEPISGNFVEQYQGSKADDPSERNDGTPLQTGDLYFNTTIGLMKVWNESTWKLASSSINGMLKKAVFTGDGSTKEFAVDGGFDANFGQVYLNGVNMTDSVDISDGQNIKFDNTPDNGDEILCIFFGSFELADAIPTTGGNCSGDISITNELKGLTLVDRSDTTKKYRLYVDNGNLGIEEV